jgi:hypothetical protein
MLLGTAEETAKSTLPYLPEPFPDELFRQLAFTACRSQRRIFPRFVRSNVQAKSEYKIPTRRSTERCKLRFCPFKLGSWFGWASAGSISSFLCRLAMRGHVRVLSAKF